MPSHSYGVRVTTDALRVPCSSNALVVRLLFYSMSRSPFVWRISCRIMSARVRAVQANVTASGGLPLAYSPHTSYAILSNLPARIRVSLNLQQIRATVTHHLLNLLVPILWAFFK